MPACTVTRTHLRGKKLAQRDRESPVPGPVGMASIKHEGLNRAVDYRYISRGQPGDPDVIPPLWEPHWLTFQSDGGMMVAGFEEIDGARYYQGWYVRWE